MAEPVSAEDEIGSVDQWESVACLPYGGAGMLARLGRVVLLVSPADEEAVAPLLDHVEMVAANGSDGRQLVRGFALQLANMAGDPPPFIAMAPVDAGLVVFASGDATAEIDGQHVTGRDSLAWVERVIRWPVRSVTARVGEGAAPTSTLLNLMRGVVQGGGFALSAGASSPMPARLEGEEPTPMATAADASAEKASSEESLATAEMEKPAATPPLVPPPPLASPAPATPPVPKRPQFEMEPERFESMVLGGPGADIEDDDVPVPLPVVSGAPRPRSARVDADSPQVKGVFCKNDHFNDPRMLFCAVCGINMVQQTPVLVDGKRPPLGVIVLDDGAVFQLDGNYLLGRDPDSDSMVRSGESRGIPLSDNQNTISRVHAGIELRRWDVVLVDNGSTNGTFYAEPNSAQWTQMAKRGEHVLAPGTRVRIGHRTLAFNTHRGS